MVLQLVIAGNKDLNILPALQSMGTILHTIRLVLVRTDKKNEFCGAGSPSKITEYFQCVFSHLEQLTLL